MSRRPQRSGNGFPPPAGCRAQRDEPPVPPLPPVEPFADSDLLVLERRRQNELRLRSRLR